MSKHRKTKVSPPNADQGPIRSNNRSQPRTRGQALIEYVLILALVAIALIAVLTITGPAVGNVFSNTVFNLLGGTVEPRDTLSADEFWEQVAAVASYTPANPGLITNTPVEPTNTWTPGPTLTASPVTPSPEPSDTPTPGPSPTPTRSGWGYPFEDYGENKDWWQHDFDDLTGTWNAQYWDYSPYGWRPDMTDIVDDPPAYETTYDELDLEFATGESPDPSVEEDFYARYTTNVSLEMKPYTFQIAKNNGIRIWVGGVLVVDVDKPNVGDPATWTTWADDPYKGATFYRTFTPVTAGPQEIEVQFVEVSGSALVQVFLLDESRLFDEGDCNWTLSQEAYRSAPSAWSDSPGTNTASRSYCILALRGYIDLTGSLNPQIEFWHRFSLESSTYAYVGVSVAGTGIWEDVLVTKGRLSDLAWRRESFDLTNFGAGNVDFRGQLIEIRFILDAKGTSVPYDGWWIDDIFVEEKIIKYYTVGFSDNMEGPLNWYAGGTWARTNEAVHSGSYAWSDSPGGLYAHGTDSSLELDGVIILDNSKLEGDPVVNPEIAFWHRYDLDYYDAIFAEVSEDGINWENLLGDYDDKNDAIAVNSTNWSWTQEVISLSAYMGKEIYLRFRIDALYDSRVGDGWWIDDFEIRNKPESFVYLDWCDNMEGGSNAWLPGGDWTLVNGPDHNPDQPSNQTILAHSGGLFWSDSPQSDYTVPSNSSLAMIPTLNLADAIAPEMVFWHLWDVGSSDDLYVEISTDGGENWNTIWMYDYNHRPPGYGNSTRYDYDYNHNLSWTREPINLDPYIGEHVNIRFRLDALKDDAGFDDGWWIDDVCFQERNEIVRTVGFSDNLESGPNNWYLGGSWVSSTYNSHSGSIALNDSNGGNYYKHQSNAILDLKGIFDLHGTVEPTLYYWDAFDLAYRDYILIEVRRTDEIGRPLGNWEEIRRDYATATSSWDRQQVDLRSFIDDYIRIRFRLYANRDSQTADGWYIDDVSVVDRDGIEPLFELPFYEDVETVNNYWVKDHTWDRIPLFRPVGSGNALGPGGWVAEYFNDNIPSTPGYRNREFDAGEFVCSEIVSEIDFNWGSGRPSCLPGNDYWLARYTRTISFVNDTEISVALQSDDGIRAFLDGAPMIDPSLTWVDRGFNSTPDVSPIFEIEGGTPHTVVIEYYEWGGSARIFVNFGIDGHVFTDSPAGLYQYNNNMSLTLEGMIDLAGTANPALSIWETYYIHWSDRGRIEISTDEGFNWTSISSRYNTRSTWTKRLYDLSWLAGDQINIRFRLDARSDESGDDGWYIDDILVAE